MLTRILIDLRQAWLALALPLVVPPWRRRCKALRQRATLWQASLSGGADRDRLGTSFVSPLSEDEFDRELDLPFRNGRAEQSSRGPACSSQGRSRSIEEVGIAVTWTRRGKVSMVHDVKYLYPELDVEILRDSPDVIVFENGEVQIRYSGTRQNIAPRIAAKIETLRECGGYRWLGRIAGLQTRWKQRAILRPKIHVGCSGNAEALRFDVIVGIAGIGERRASRTAQSIRECEIVAAECPCRVTTSPPSGSERHAVTHCEDKAEFPAIREPASWTGPGLSRRNIPRAIQKKGPPNVEIGQATGQFHVKPIEARN